jgi:prepilin-type N-terminal cleavage/methylation domain-containing protein
MRRPDAFSVLELLIVVAIIGVLAGILLVVFHAV